MTVYVQVLFPGDDKIRKDAWTPWLGCKSRDETAAMAANKAARESGFFREAAPGRLRLRVAHFTETDERYPSGAPKACIVTVVDIVKTPKGTAA